MKTTIWVAIKQLPAGMFFARIHNKNKEFIGDSRPFDTKKDLWGWLRNFYPHYIIKEIK